MREYAILFTETADRLSREWFELQNPYPAKKLIVSRTVHHKGYHDDYRATHDIHYHNAVYDQSAITYQPSAVHIAVPTVSKTV